LENRSIQSSLLEVNNEVFEKSSWFYIYKKVFFLAIQASLVFAITFLIYPGTFLGTTFNFLKGNSSEKAWFNILMITIFSFGDTLGRFLAGPLKLFTSKTVVILTFGRLIFITSAVLVQKSVSPAWLFQSDWFKIVNIWLFAATNGYNMAVIMLFGPQKVKAIDKERAGLIMNFHLIGGVWIGTVFAAFVMEKV
jgi:hypothetical protein